MSAPAENPPSVRPLGTFPFFAEQNRRQGWRGRLVGRLLPRHTFAPIGEELRATWVRLLGARERRRHRGASELLVNVGAGPFGRSGWVNVDVFRIPGINCLHDSRASLPFPDGAVKAIFCEHFFEHLDLNEEVPRFLAECRRVLRRGGVLRVIVPDMERYLRAYRDGGWLALEQIRPLEAGRWDPRVKSSFRTRMELLNVVFWQAYQHKYAYDEETLCSVLSRHGFARVEGRRFGESEMPEACLDQSSRRSESIYVEAIR